MVFATLYITEHNVFSVTTKRVVRVLSVTTKSAFFPCFEKLDGGMVIATQLLVYLAIIKVQIANKKEDFFF